MMSDGPSQKRSSPKIGFDLDGVFFNDYVLNDTSDQEIDMMTQCRKRLVPIASIPWFCLDNYIIISSRPRPDYALIQESFETIGINNVNLICNPTCDPLDQEDAAKFKAQLIITELVQVYVESHPEQAKRIQDLVGSRCRVMTFQDLFQIALATVLRA